MRPIHLFALFFIGIHAFAQNTIGVLSNDTGSYNGYTLFTPLASNETYLINNCGQLVHQWSSSSFPGNSVYLLENGNLLRSGKITNPDITFGGVGGKIELFDWDGNLLWDYTYSTSEVSQHHDIFPLPNGNVLMLAVTTITEAEAIQAGRDPLKIAQGKLYNEQILELEPIIGTSQANIIWEWNIKDHLIQDIDNTKDNFGIVTDNPQLLDINYLNATTGNANWLHINSINYNESLDQIVMSSRLLSEIYIIDHSTSISEAAMHSGGTYGKGGDFLYRWGNPEAYKHGTSTDRTLFKQHYPHWIPNGLSDAGKLLIFNNGGDRLFSSIDIIDPPVTTPGVYTYNAIDGYLPSNAEWSYTNSVPTNFVSAILSSAQRLPNGNTLICDGDSGYFFEIDINDNIVWEYINPVSSNGPLAQGDIPILNLTFRAHKYSENYPAFVGRNLIPGDPIELNFDIGFCELLAVSEYSITNLLTVYPNPTSKTVYINTNLSIDKIEIYNVFGKLIKNRNNSKKINIEQLADGIYFAKIYSDNQIGIKKIIKK